MHEWSAQVDSPKIKKKALTVIHKIIQSIIHLSDAVFTGVYDNQ